jgi:hypothetical protein
MTEDERRSTVYIDIEAQVGGRLMEKLAPIPPYHP